MTASARNLEVPDTLAIRKAAQPIRSVSQYTVPRPTADDDGDSVVQGPWQRPPAPVALTPATIACYRQRGRVLRSEAFRGLLRRAAVQLRPTRPISAI